MSSAPKTKKSKKLAPKPLTPYEAPMRLSEALDSLAHDTTRERISTADLLHIMDQRAIAALMFTFAFPNLLPKPPGVSALFSIPLMFLSFQLTFGLKPWLPQAILKRSMPRKNFLKLVKQLSPWLIKAENYIKPRAGFLVAAPMTILMGIVCLLLSVIIFLPIPFGNFLPALSICFFALGILGRDGLWVLSAFLLTLASVAIVGTIAYAVAKAALLFLFNAF